jgi:hypothetical protein
MSLHAGCAECRSLLGGYVLHALEPDEVDAVRAHLATCEACAAEHGELVGLPALLDVAGSTESLQEQPPAALEEAVLDRFAREATRAKATGAEAPATTTGTHAPEAERSAKTWLARRLASARGRLARPFPAALTGAVAAAAITATLIVLPGGPDSAEGNVYEASLDGTSAIPQAHAYAKLKIGSAGTNVNLSVRNLRGQPDSVYELWCIRDDGAKVSAGTFRTDSGGRADVSLTTAAVPGEYHRLSVERKAFSRTAASGERVMAGEIQYPRW